MAGRWSLDPLVGVRIPAPQQDKQTRPWLNWIEHLTSDQRVGGSNPPGRA